MKCVKLVATPDGSYKLVDDPQADVQLCEYVLQTGSEAGNSLLSLTPEQALELGGVAGLVLCTAWVFKMLARTISESENTNE